jgi:hypothetical protein
LVKNKKSVFSKIKKITNLWKVSNPELIEKIVAKNCNHAEAMATN